MEEEKVKEKFILDACCGPRFMWFNKDHPNTLYIDIRKEEKGFIEKRPNCEIRPDMIADFRDLHQLKDNSFKLIVWDPPFIFRKDFHPKHDITKKYGILSRETWREDYRKGFKELWRVLEDHGVLIFKLNDCDGIKFQEVLDLFSEKPLFGNTVNNLKSHTKWFCFMKIPD